MRKIASIALAAALSLSLAACGSDSEESDTAAKDPSAPVAEIANLTGEDDEVTLDPAFVAGLTRPSS